MVSLEMSNRILFFMFGAATFLAVFIAEIGMILGLAIPVLIYILRGGNVLW